MDSKGKKRKCLFKTSMSMPEKIVRIFQIDGEYMIDYRQTLNGKLTSEGIILNYQEWRWLKRALFASEQDLIVLPSENGRTLTVDGRGEMATISLDDENGDKNKITLYNDDEFRILIEKHYEVYRAIEMLKEATQKEKTLEFRKPKIPKAQITEWPKHKMIKRSKIQKTETKKNELNI